MRSKRISARFLFRSGCFFVPLLAVTAVVGQGNPSSSPTNAAPDRLKNLEESLEFIQQELAKQISDLMWFQRLQDIADWDQRFDLLDDTLADCLHEPSVRTSVVSWAVERIQEAGGALSIRALSSELGYSGKHVISMFRDQVGIPPKLLARIVRFDRLIRHFRNGGGGAWSDLALEFGFYDQAHLVRDVRHFTGVTPTEAKAMVTRLDGLAS